MANVISRVELHGYPEESAQYRSLHAEMDRAGFRRAIIDVQTGKSYHLPHATYSSGIYPTVAAAHTAAMAAAALIQTTKGHGVITSGAEIFFDGLRPV